MSTETRESASANASGDLRLSSIDWEAEARQALRALLARKGCSYKTLARKLEDGGVKASARVLSNRVARGGFSFAFVMQVAKALGVESVDVRPVAAPRPAATVQTGEG